MRYTEYEYKLDHVFDFIRLIFSSIFLAPFRLINEISKKVIYLDKYILEKVIIGAIITNLILIVYNIITMIYTRQVALINGNLPLASELISLAGICGIYYIVFIYQQPILRKVNKPEKEQKEYKKPKEHINPDLEMEDDLLISDENMDDVLSALEDTEPLEKNKEPRIASTKEEMNDIINQVDDVLDIGILDTVKEASNSLHREDEIVQAHKDCEDAIETDKYGLNDLLSSIPENNDGDDEILFDMDEIENFVFDDLQPEGLDMGELFTDFDSLE